MKSIKVALCDDSQDIRNITRQYLEEYSNSKDVKFNIIEYVSGEDLKENWDSECSVLFLDIDLPGADGIETAECLSAKHNLSEWLR